jgi:hypothetical protein
VDPIEKTRENRLRRVAYRQGLQLVKSRTRDPRALDYGVYHLMRGEAVVPESVDSDLNAIEAFLTGDRP